MSLTERVHAVVGAAQSAPPPVSLTVMIGSLVLSVLQPIAVVVTIAWGCLQIHGFVDKRWGRDFLWLNRFLRKAK